MKILYTPVNPNFTISKWGVRGYKSHGHVCLMMTLLLCTFLYRPCPETTFDRYTEVIAKPIRYMLKIEAAQSTKSRRKDGNQRRGTSQLNSEDQQMMTVARNMITGKKLATI